jgi:hypothetical protein
MAQAKTIQLLRSSQAYTNIEAAKTALLGRTGQKDGEILLARYWATEGNTSVVKSLLGIYHSAPDLSGTGITEGTTKGWTFIQDQSSIDSILDGLDANINYTTGESGASDSATDDSLIVVGVKQANGQVSALTSELGSVKVSSVTATSATSKIAAEQTLSENLGRLQGQIDDMDLAQVGGTDGDVITTVSQSDGKVSASKSSLTDVAMTGYSKTNDTGAIAATDTLEEAFSKVENAIAANDVHSNDKSITVAADTTNGGTNIEVNVDGTTIVKDGTSHALKSGLTLAKITTGLSTNVKEAYQLQDASNNQIGAQIDIYKDSALQEVYLGASTDTINATTGVITKNTVTDPQSMNFAYQLADGTYSLTKIDVSKFLTESEFGDGLEVSGTGVVSVKVGNGLEIDGTSKAVNVKIDSTSESFLTVGAGGVKLSGVQDAIDAVKVTTDNTGATYVNLAVDNATGRVLTLTNTIQAVSTADSSNQGLAEASDVKDYVDSAVANKNVSASGDNYVSASASNNAVTIATNVQNLTFTQGSGSTDSTLSGTANSLADGSDIATKVSSFTNARISEEIAKLDGSATATAASGDVYTVLTSVTETDGVIAKGGEVTLAAVAKTGAAADVSVADSGNLLTATDVEGALAEIATEMGNGLNSVTSANAAIAVGTKTNKSQELTFQVSANCAKQADGTTNMLTIENDGLKLADTWDCGTF